MRLQQSYEIASQMKVYSLCIYLFNHFVMTVIYNLQKKGSMTSASSDNDNNEYTIDFTRQPSFESVPLV